MSYSHGMLYSEELVRYLFSLVAMGTELWGSCMAKKKRERQWAKTRQNNRTPYDRTGEPFWGHVTKSINFEEIVLRAHGNFEEQNKV